MSTAADEAKVPMPTRDSNPPVRTKIIATLGPATSDPERLAGLLEAGVDACRLNFSHGTLDDHAHNLAAVRAWSERNERPITGEIPKTVKKL